MSDREYEIEVFRAGTAASKGLTADLVAAGIAAYDAEGAPAPIVEGHPEHDKPARGILSKFRMDGNRLFATLSNVADEIVEGVREKKWLNRSMAFWSPTHPSNPKPGVYYPKHLGLLGAAQPAIAGMPPLRFSADEAAIEADELPHTAVIFEAEEPATPIAIVKSKGAAPVADEPKTFTAEDIAAKDAEIARLRELAEANRKADHVAFADTMIAAGTLKPADKDDLVAVFDALSPDVIEFSAERKEPASAVLKRLLGGAKPVIKFGAVVNPEDEPKGDKTAEEKAQLAFAAANERQAKAWKGAAA